ncbi:MAG: hypothetical protein ACREFD_01645 [Stellaceae bacterium]
MDALPRDLPDHERRLARRIERLFRLERHGAWARRSREVAARLTTRRGDLIAALVRADAMRRTLTLPPSDEMQTAMAALWDEVARARGSADARLRQLESELRIASGEGIASGARGSSAGRLLGKG